jgi:hypothetical protein
MQGVDVNAAQPRQLVACDVDQLDCNRKFMH